MVAPAGAALPQWERKWGEPQSLLSGLEQENETGTELGKISRRGSETSLSHSKDLEKEARLDVVLGNPI